jgi:hypothetical protein
MPTTNINSKKKAEAKGSSVKSKSYSALSTPSTADIRMTTVVSSQNMHLIIEKIIECCGKDIAWEIKDEDALEMYMTRTGQHFTVKEGDNWGDIKKRIQSSAVVCRCRKV